MNSKNKKMVLTISGLLFISSIILEIIALKIQNNMSANVIAVFGSSCLIPFSASLLLISFVFSEKYKVLKAILRIIAALFLILFLLFCIVAVFVGFAKNGYGGVSASW